MQTLDPTKMPISGDATQVEGDIPALLATVASGQAALEFAARCAEQQTALRDWAAAYEQRQGGASPVEEA